MAGGRTTAVSRHLADLEDLFENAPCGYLSAQSDGVITKANRTFASWMGYEPGYFIGRRFQSFLNIAGKIYFETHFAPLLKMQGFFNEVALDLVRADDTIMPVLVNAVERRDDSDELSFLRITIFNTTDRRRYERELLEARRSAEQASAQLRDLNATLESRIEEAVRERLKTEEALRQAQKMEAVGQLTGGIAHDFNNMLAIVLSGLELVQRKIDRGDTDVSELVTAARDGANRAAALTQRLLTFSRQQHLSPQPINPNQLVASISELLRRTLGETIRMKTELAEDLCQIYADGHQLENAMVNLAVNARDAMQHGGQLTIETANIYLDEAYAAEHAIATGYYAAVAVSDTGCGMEPEVVAKAFDPFFTTKEVGKGTGLGLSQVFGFVKQSGGHVNIYSEPGHGTTVKIYLPRYGVAAKGPKILRKEEQQQFGSRGEVIVVAEDDDQVRALSVKMLRELGYEPIEAGSGDEALRVLSDHPEVDLLFTDVIMPDMSGMQLVGKALCEKPGLKILFTTGYALDAAGHGGLSPGDNFLPKPATLEQMASKIRSVLDA